MNHLSAKELAHEAFLELTGNILPFWMNQAVDHQNGGFVGQIQGNGLINPDSCKGGILNARILWTFSAAYNLLQKKEYLQWAERSKAYIFDHFMDREFGGTYWELNHSGTVSDPKKQIYAQAFFIYGLSEYYKASKDQETLHAAVSIFHLIEKMSFDSRENGYLEAFSRDWKLLEDLRLSEKDVNEKKTTNTHLHILEGYANLYDVWPDSLLKKQLRNLILLFTDKIIHSQNHHLNLFFDEHWKNKSALVSYGHDIEASWLILEAARKLEDPELLSRVKQSCYNLAIAGLEGLMEDGSMIYERDDSHHMLNKDLHWWPQAETLVGLINLYELTAEEQFLHKALKTWNFIQNHLVDRVHGEWYWSIRNGLPNTVDDKAGFWKCPYHNSRACIEIIRRLEKQ